MLARLLPMFAALAATVALPAVAAPPPAVHRLVAVGDLHGDLAAWRAIARDAGLIDAQNHWAGGTATLVQTGDIVDRGPQSRALVEELIRLQREAAKAKGRVVVLVGNHEAMNVIDDLRYLVPADYAAFADAHSEALRQQLYDANKPAIEAAYRQRDAAMTPEAIRAAWLKANPPGLIEHQAAWHPTGRIGKWVVSCPTVAVIDGTLFVHGGIAPAYAGVAVAEINRRVAAALAARDSAPTSILVAANSPLWYRGLAVPEAGAPPVATQLDAVLRTSGAKRLVIAHTPNLSGIQITEGGRLIRIDTGISQAYKGTLSWLAIAGDSVTPHVVPRPAASEVRP